MDRKHWILAAFGSAVAITMTACGGGGSDATGTMRLALTDAPACGSIDKVWVTVQKVRVHKSSTAGDNDSGWQEIALAAPPPRIDLLEYTNGKTLELGATTLPAGTYTQMRLVLAPNSGGAPWPNAIKPAGGAETALDTPSGQQTGLKFNVQMEVAAGEVADFMIDFDACRSFVKAGASGKYLLKPVVRVIPVLSPAGQSIVGYVEPSLARGDTLVSVQDNNGNVVKSTPPMADGKFVLSPVPLNPPLNTYNLVITAAGRVNAVMTGVPVTGGTAPTAINAASAPLSPPAADASAAVGGTVTPPSADADVRALQTLSGGAKVEVAYAGANATTGAYTMTLPRGALQTVPYGASTITFTPDPATVDKYTIEARSGSATKATDPPIMLPLAGSLDFVFP